MRIVSSRTTLHHAPMMLPLVEKPASDGLRVIFEIEGVAEETAREVADTLARKGWGNEQERMGRYRFLTTGDPALFRTLGERFLQLPIEQVEHVAQFMAGHQQIVDEPRVDLRVVHRVVTGRVVPRVHDLGFENPWKCHR